MLTHVARFEYVFGRFVGAFAIAAAMLPISAQAQSSPHPSSLVPAAPGRPVEGALAWQPYSTELLEAQRDSGRIVLLDFTADWCLTCKVNGRVALGSAVRVAIRDHDVALLRADWTTRDPVVTRALAAFGRPSVPFVVIYPRARDAAPIVTPTLLTCGIVTRALGHAAASPSGGRTSAALTSGRIVPPPSLEATP